MSDNSPNIARNTERRQVVVTVVCVFSFMVALATTAIGLRKLIGERTDMEPGVMGFLIVVSAVFSGSLAAILAGFAVNRILLSTWPETPDDSHDG